MILAGLNLLCGLVLSAYGAHAGALTPGEGAWFSFQTATTIQLVHGLGLGLTGLSLGRIGATRLLYAAGLAHAAGVVLFSGGIYAKALFAAYTLGPLVPWGGAALMVGWLLFTVAWSIGPHRSSDSR